MDRDQISSTLDPLFIILPRDFRWKYKECVRRQKQSTNIFHITNAYSLVLRKLVYLGPMWPIFFSYLLLWSSMQDHFKLFCSAFLSLLYKLLPFHQTVIFLTVMIFQNCHTCLVSNCYKICFRNRFKWVCPFKIIKNIHKALHISMLEFQQRSTAINAHPQFARKKSELSQAPRILIL